MNRLAGWKLLASVSLGIAFIALSARAEDPLLGEIKAIKCVGCEQGKVTLVIHDPIDVRDFEVTIQDADFNKIVTPLPGKRIFDRGDGCFYWDETPKVAKKDADKATGKDSTKVAGKEPGRELGKDMGKTPGKKTATVKSGKKDPTASAAAATADSVTVAKNDDAPATPEPEMKPSRCLPYFKVALPKVGKQD